MNADEILNALSKIEQEINSILSLFDKGRIPREHVETSQLLLKILKEHIGSEYKRMSTINGSQNISLHEENFYQPAIRDAWANACLSSLKWNSRPDRKWFSVLYDVKGYMNYWRINLLSAQVA